MALLLISEELNAGNYAQKGLSFSSGQGSLLPEAEGPVSRELLSLKTTLELLVDDINDSTTQ